MNDVWQIVVCFDWFVSSDSVELVGVVKGVLLVLRHTLLVTSGSYGTNWLTLDVTLGENLRD